VKKLAREFEIARFGSHIAVLGWLRSLSDLR
jgi:hypothetical protein